MTDKPPQRIARARRAYDKAYERLIEAIRQDLASDSVSVSEAARQSEWSREYVTQIRDGKAGDSPPKRRMTDRRTSAS